MGHVIIGNSNNLPESSVWTSSTIISDTYLCQLKLRFKSNFIYLLEVVIEWVYKL